MEYLVLFFFFFFKQKTAYELRISDWSSDVCSSDLIAGDVKLVGGDVGRRTGGQGGGQCVAIGIIGDAGPILELDDLFGAVPDRGKDVASDPGKEDRAGDVAFGRQDHALLADAGRGPDAGFAHSPHQPAQRRRFRSEEHTSELQSLMR